MKKLIGKQNFGLFGISISLLMLIATFKRTDGWGRVGIILILIIKKMDYSCTVTLAGIILFITDKNISLVSVYNFKERSGKVILIQYEGRATTISK